MTVQSKEREILGFRLSRNAALALILVVASGLGVSLVLFFTVRGWDRALFRSSFERQCQHAVTSLKMGIDTHFFVLNSLRSFYESSDKMTRQEFSQFVRGFLKRYRGIQAIEWIPRVRESERTEYEKSAQHEGFPGFRITQKNHSGRLVVAPKRQEYYPVYYVEPYAGNEAALGYDLASDPAMREALSLSRDTGKLAATPPVRLVQETGSQLGFLVFLPVYQRGAAENSLEARRENIAGFFLAVFRVADLINTILEQHGSVELDFSVFDQSDHGAKKLLFFSSSREDGSPAREDRLLAAVSAGPRRTEHLKIGSREWLILLAPNPNLIQTSRTWIPWAALVAGFLFTGFMATYFVQVHRGAEQDRRHASEQASSREALEREMALREATESTLEVSERRYRTLFESATDAVFIMEAEGPDSGRIVEANKAAAQLHGFTREEILNLNIRDLDTPESAEKISSRIARLLEGEHLMEEAAHRKKDGSSFPVEINARVIELDGHNYILAIDRDITDRKLQEAALRQRDSQQRAILDNIPDIAWLKDKESRFIAVNEPFAAACGLKVEDLPGKTDLDIWPQELAELYRADDRHVMSSGRRKRVEEPLADKEGQIQWIETIKTPIYDEGGNIIGTTGIARDITERRLAQEALEESEERYRQLVEMSPDGIAVHQDGHLVFVNQAAADMVGARSREELIGKPIREIVHPDYWEIASERIQRMMTGETGLYPVEDCYVKSDGTPFPVEVTALPLTFSGKPAVQVVVRDISERKRAEQVERRLVTAIDQATEGVLITDNEGTIEYVNPGLEKISGYTRDELIGQTPRIFKSGSHDELFYRQLWDSIKGGKTWTGQFINRRKDGKLYHEEASVSPVKDTSGRISNFVAVKRDITEHLEMSRQLYQAQKMEAIGTLASGVSHDFNNVLQVVLGYTELILGDEKFLARYRGDVHKVHEAARRGADLVQRLLTFSRKTEINPSPLNLNRRISELLKMLERTLPKMVEIRLALDDDLATIHADPTQIDQVLMNLAVNARDAMPHGGKLTFETSNVVLDKEYARMHVEAIPGHYVLLTISDTGSGIDKDALEHIFEPFYTTKRVGEGTGLGLAMVHGIVKQHRGHITCYSKLGHGTTFSIYFPAETSRGDGEQPKVTHLPRGGSETILLVDDEELIRDLGSRILTEAGYRVFKAVNGKEALDMYEAHSASIALVILDLIMPEMGGKQCLENLLRLNPSAKVVIASGHLANGSTKEAMAAGAKGFVKKPYNIQQMLEVVREVLDNERGKVE